MGTGSLAPNGRNSFIGKKIDFQNIPNPIDTTVFTDTKRNDAREKFKFDDEHIYILVGAMSPTDERKGYHYFKKLTENLDRSLYTAVIYGNTCDRKLELGIPAIEMGIIYDTTQLIELYNAVDVFVAPSIQENLANTVMESLACGTPVVAFSIGGMPDMITTNVNGYLANSFNVVDLKRGVEICTSDFAFRKRARESVITRFSYEKLIDKYLNVYMR